MADARVSALRASPTRLLTVATGVAAVPFLVLAVVAVAQGSASLLAVVALSIASAALAFWPIKVRPNLEISPADVTVLAAIIFVPPASPIVGAIARLVRGVVFGRPPVRIARDVAAISVSAGAAAVVFQITHDVLAAGFP